VGFLIRISTYCKNLNCMSGRSASVLWNVTGAHSCCCWTLLHFDHFSLNFLVLLNFIKTGCTMATLQVAARQSPCGVPTILSQFGHSSMLPRPVRRWLGVKQKTRAAAVARWRGGGRAAPVCLLLSLLCHLFVNFDGGIPSNKGSYGLG
jgi:hypothetical protein